MTESKLINLLKTFTKKEMKDFRKFISSPYFASGRNLKPLYNLLKKYYPDFKPAAFTEEKLFAKLYPGKRYEGKKSSHALSVIISEMYVMAEKFLQAERYFNTNVYKDILLLLELENRELLGHFEISSVKILKADESQPKNPSSLLKKLLFNLAKERAGRQKNTATVYSYNQNVIAAEESLIIYFLSKLSNIMLMRKMNYIKEEPKNELVELFHSHFDYEKFSEELLNTKNDGNFLVQMHIYASRLDFDYNDIVSYEALKKMIYAHKNNLTAEYFWLFSHSLINCSLFQNRGDVNYYKNDYLDLYDALLKKSIEEKNFRLLSRDLLLIKGIYNYAKICVKINRLERLEKFIKDYSKYFFEPIKKDSIYFSEGYLEFARGNFKKALELLSKTNFAMPMLFKEIKIIKMKICYELGYYDLLDSEIDAYRHFLVSTKEINETHIKSDKELMIFLRRLSRIKESSKIRDLPLLKKDINNLTFKTFHNDWLLRKIAELE